MAKKLKRSPGRPRSDDARDVMINVRVSREELDLLTRAAKEDQRPVSQWVRMAAVDVARGLPR